MPVFERSVDLPVSREEAFAWHEREGALERLTPPWETFTVLERSGPGGVKDGTRLKARVGLLGELGPTWVALHQGYRPPEEFQDKQESGPFAEWLHQHLFTAMGPNTSRLTDRITWDLPVVHGLGRVGVEPKLERMFAYRHALLLRDLVRHAEGPGRPLRIAVTGASGFVGSQLVPFLRTGGHEVLSLVRGQPRGPWDRRWDPVSGRVEDLGRVDAVLHLAGASLLSRWTEAKKKDFWSSRVDATRALCTFLAEEPEPPAAFVSASAIGWYGDRGDEELTEDSAGGTGFLAELCAAWEEAASPLRGKSRITHPRVGLVLGIGGGPLGPLLPLFQAGAGGPTGDGRMQMSWVSRDDLLAMLLRAAWDERFVGPFNAVGPAPVPNREFTRTLGRVLGRPALVAVPAAAIELAMGKEMARETALASQKVLPRRLEGWGFRWDDRTLEGALRFALGHSS